MISGWSSIRRVRADRIKHVQRGRSRRRVDRCGRRWNAQTDSSRLSPRKSRLPAAIAFCDLARATGPIRADIDAAISRVIDSSSYLRGRETAAFEEEWADYCGQGHCVACNSGTDALTLAASGLDMRGGGVQANTLAMTAIGLHRGGAEVTVHDIGEDGRLPRFTQGSVPVLLFGRRP